MDTAELDGSLPRWGGVGPLVTRLLAPRLGSTLLISNLGLLGRPGVERLEFWPVPSGPAAAEQGQDRAPTALASP